MNAVPLYDVRKVPCRGQITSGHASALPAGLFRRVVNYVLTERTLKVRKGISEVTANAVDSSAVFLGADFVTLNGTDYLVCAYHFSAEARVFYISDIDGAASFTEITTASGKMGNTRLGNNLEAISFSVVRDVEIERDLLVIQNGAVAPVVWDSVTNESWRHEFVRPPSSFSVAVFREFDNHKVYYSTGSAHSFTNPNSPRMVMADRILPDSPPSGTESDYIKLSFASAQLGDLSRCDFGGSDVVDASAVSQLWIWFEGDIAWVQNVKIDISENGTTWFLVHDPTNPGGATSSFLVPDGADRHILVCSLEHIQPESRDTVRHLRVTWASTTNSDTFNIKIFVVAYSGNVPGASEYLITNYSEGSRVESIGVSPKQIIGGLMFDMGGVHTNVNIPISPKMLYSVLLNCNVYGEEGSRGTNLINVYRLDPNEEEYTFVKKHVYGVWTGSAWEHTPSGVPFTSLPFHNVGIVDNIPTIEKKREKLAPRDTDIPIPIGRVMKRIGQRLWVGDTIESAPRRKIVGATAGTETVLHYDNAAGYNAGDYIVISGVVGVGWTGLNGIRRIVRRSTTQNRVVVDYDSSGHGAFSSPNASSIGVRAGGAIYLSGHKRFTRFSRELFIRGGIPDQDAPNRIMLSGERVVAVEGTSIFGIDHVILSSDRWLFMVSGTLSTDLSRLISMGAHGSLSPRSFARHGLDMYWLDQKRQVRSLYGGVMRSLSRDRVDDILRMITSLSAVSGGFFNDRYYLSFRTEGNRNNRCLVYDERIGNQLSGWVEYEFPEPVSAEQIVIGVINEVERFYCFANNGKLYRAEIGDNDLGLPIQTRLETAQIHDGIFNQMEFGRVGIIASKPEHGELRITKRGIPYEHQRDGRINLSDVNTKDAYLWEVNTVSGEDTIVPGFFQNSSEVIIEGLVDGDTELYSVVMEVAVKGVRAEISN